MIKSEDELIRVVFGENHNFISEHESFDAINANVIRNLINNRNINPGTRFTNESPTTEEVIGFLLSLSAECYVGGGVYSLYGSETGDLYISSFYVESLSHDDYMAITMFVNKYTLEYEIICEGQAILIQWEE